MTGHLVPGAADAAAPGRVRYAEARSEAAAVLADLVRPGDLVITLGAGDVTLVGPELARLLAPSDVMTQVRDATARLTSASAAIAAAGVGGG